LFAIQESVRSVPHAFSRWLTAFSLAYSSPTRNNVVFDACRTAVLEQMGRVDHKTRFPFCIEWSGRIIE
jgi:hypothetical protein